MRTWGLGGGGSSKSHTWYMNISGDSEQDNNNLKYASPSVTEYYYYHFITDITELLSLFEKLVCCLQFLT